MFYVGQKICCVDARPARDRGAGALRLGAIYTVRGIDPENGTGVLLEELLGPVIPPWKLETGWCPRRFRPVVERKTSIEIFQRMLTDNREHV